MPVAVDQKKKAEVAFPLQENDAFSPICLVVLIMSRMRGILKLGVDMDLDGQAMLSIHVGLIQCLSPHAAMCAPTDLVFRYLGSTRTVGARHSGFAEFRWRVSRLRGVLI